MQTKIQPKLFKVDVTCSTCNSTYQINSIKSALKIDNCSHCHPFYTGQNTFKRATGRVEKFNKKYVDKK